MKIVVQRVNKANVEVKGKTVGKIGKGLFVLVGVGKGDQLEDAKLLADKLTKLRIMADSKGKMNFAVNDGNWKVLAVSQFTLYADTKKGNRPSFIQAADPRKAERVYEHFVESLVGMGIGVETGRFGEYMKITAELDGPVTIVLDSQTT